MVAVPDLKIGKSKDQHHLEEQLQRNFGKIQTWMRAQPAPTGTPAAATSPFETPPFPTNQSGNSAVSPANVQAGNGIAVAQSDNGVMVSNTGVTDLSAQGLSGATGAITGGTVAQRVTTGSIALSSTVPVTLTWTTPFADANYTPMACVLDSTGFLQVVDIASYTASEVVVNVKNNDGANPHTGTLLLMALHD